VRSPNVEVLGSLIALALFSVIGGIFSMAARLRGPFLGPTGYVRSCVTGQVAWPAGFFGIFGMFVALVYVMR
jgi:hypothetical protein